MKKKILSSLLAVCLFVGAAIPSVFAYTSDLAGNAQKVTKITILDKKYDIKEGENRDFSQQISVYETKSKLVVDLQQIRYTATGDTNFFNITGDGVVTAVKAGGTITLTIYDDQNKSARVDTIVNSIPGAGINGNYATSFKFGNASRYDAVYDNVDTYKKDSAYYTVSAEKFSFAVDSIPSGTMFNNVNEQNIIDKVVAEMNAKLGLTNLIGQPIYGSADSSTKATIAIEINHLLNNGIATGKVFSIGGVTVVGTVTTNGQRLASLNAIKDAITGKTLIFGGEKFNYVPSETANSRLFFRAEASKKTTVTEQQVIDAVSNDLTTLTNNNSVAVIGGSAGSVVSGNKESFTLTPALTNTFTAGDTVVFTVGDKVFPAVTLTGSALALTDLLASFATANASATINGVLYNIALNTPTNTILTFTAANTGVAAVKVTGASAAIVSTTTPNAPTVAPTYAAGTPGTADTNPTASATTATISLDGILASGIANNAAFTIGSANLRGTADSAKSFANAIALVATTFNARTTIIDGVTYTMDTTATTAINPIVTLTATTTGVAAADTGAKIAATVFNNGVVLGNNTNVIKIDDGEATASGYYKGVVADDIVTGQKTSIGFSVAANEMQTPMGSMAFNKNVPAEIKHLMVRQDGSNGLNVTAKTTLNAVKAIPVEKVGFMTNDTLKVGEFKTYEVTYYPSNANVGKASNVEFSTLRRNDLNNVDKYEHAVITGKETGKVTVRAIDSSVDAGKTNAVTTLRATVTTSTNATTTHDANITVVDQDYTGADIRTPYLNTTTGAIKVGGQMVLSVKDTVAGTTVKWSIDNDNVSIDPATGLATTIRGKKVGTSVVTAVLSTGEAFKATITVAAADVVVTPDPTTPDPTPTTPTPGPSKNPQTGDTLFANIG